MAQILFARNQCVQANCKGRKETTLSHQLKPLPRVSLQLGNHYFSGNFSTGNHSEVKCP